MTVIDPDAAAQTRLAATWQAAGPVILRMGGQAGASGILATRPEDARRYLDWDFRFVAGGQDVGLLTGAARALRAAMAEGGTA